MRSDQFYRNLRHGKSRDISNCSLVSSVKSKVYNYPFLKPFLNLSHDDSNQQEANGKEKNLKTSRCQEDITTETRQACVFRSTRLFHSSFPNKSTTGFISIDCGLPDSSSGYLDPETSKYYVPDAGFVDTGENVNLTSDFVNSSPNLIWKNLQNVRSFPNGTRNCYTLKPEDGKNNNYLIRANFLYGNYDNKSTMPTFLLYLGTNLWDSLSVTNENVLLVKEIIHFSLMDYIDVCLVNINTGVPFISSLELRPLNNSIYRTDDSSKSLVKLGRNFFGQYTIGTPVRFEDDIHDRTWDPQSTSGFTLTRANAIIESTSDYRPPSSVMRTAISSSSTGSWLYYSWTPPEIYPEYYLCLHFAEVLVSDNSALRQFDIDLYGTKWYPETIALKLLSSTTICSNSSSNVSSIDFSFSPTNISGCPPMLNAIEIYKFKDFSQLPTELDDVDGIVSVKEFYGVKKNWQGDP